MTWGTYLLRLFLSGGAFAGVVALALAARGVRGWWIASTLGALALSYLALASGERGIRLAFYFVLLAAAAAVAALVVRWRAAGGRRLLVPWALRTVAFAATWIASTVLLFRPR